MADKLDPTQLTELVSAVYTHELTRHLRELRYNLDHIESALAEDDWPSPFTAREVARLGALVSADIVGPLAWVEHCTAAKE